MKHSQYFENVLFNTKTKQFVLPFYLPIKIMAMKKTESNSESKK